MEGSDGPGGQPRQHGSSHARPDRNLAGDPAAIGLVYPSGGLRLISVPRQSLGLRVGHRVDMGAARSCPCFLRACTGTGRASMGHRRVAGPTKSFIAVVVSSEPACECQSSFPLIMKRKLLVACSVIFHEILSPRSSLLIAIRQMALQA